MHVVTGLGKPVEEKIYIWRGNYRLLTLQSGPCSGLESTDYSTRQCSNLLEGPTIKVSATGSAFTFKSRCLRLQAK